MGPCVESVREVDEQDRRHPDKAESGHDQAQTPAVTSSGEQAEERGEKAEGNEQVGVGLAGGLDVDGGWPRRTGHARVGSLTDLDPTVVEELGGDEPGPGGGDDNADRPLWGDDGAGAGRDAHRGRAAAS
ncbi:MAG TPA: hypothetical protein VFI03_08740 [Solirubrobacterales bacterium]|nr:hypothetical protein [Solirubrobacterales bacterium]